MLAEDISHGQKRVTIILNSGAYDRASCALCITQAALASGMEVHMLLTFEGLKRFTKGRLTDTGSRETTAAVQADIEQALETGAMQPLEEQLAEAKKMGLKIYACPNAMAGLDIPLRDLLEVDEVMGLVAFLGLASAADINWFI